MHDEFAALTVDMPFQFFGNSNAFFICVCFLNNVCKFHGISIQGIDGRWRDAHDISQFEH